MKFAFELLQHITRVINKVHFAEESLRSEKKENNESSYTALRLCLRLSCEIFWLSLTVIIKSCGNEGRSTMFIQSTTPLNAWCSNPLSSLAIIDV